MKKKTIGLILAALLLLSGCKANVPAETTDPPETTGATGTNAATETTAAPTEMTLPEEMTFPTVPTPGGILTEPEGDQIPFENPGKVRIAYTPTGIQSFVMYVTRVEDLPNEEALKGYDEAFFAEHALLIVVETVNSGSVQLEIGGIYRDGDTATVKLNRSMPGDVGTADMATWLLWAEVSREQDCKWVLDSGTRQPQNEKY